MYRVVRQWILKNELRILTLRGAPRRVTPLRAFVFTVSLFMRRIFHRRTREGLIFTRWREVCLLIELARQEAVIPLWPQRKRRQNAPCLPQLLENWSSLQGEYKDVFHFLYVVTNRFEKAQTSTTPQTQCDHALGTRKTVLECQSNKFPVCH